MKRTRCDTLLRRRQKVDESRARRLASASAPSRAHAPRKLGPPAMLRFSGVEIVCSRSSSISSAGGASARILRGLNTASLRKRTRPAPQRPPVDAARTRDSRSIRVARPASSHRDVCHKLRLRTAGCGRRLRAWRGAVESYRALCGTM